MVKWKFAHVPFYSQRNNVPTTFRNRRAMPIAVSEDMLRWLSSRNCNTHPGSFDLQKQNRPQQKRSRMNKQGCTDRKREHKETGVQLESADKPGYNPDYHMYEDSTLYIESAALMAQPVISKPFSVKSHDLRLFLTSCSTLDDEDVVNCTIFDLTVDEGKEPPNQFRDEKDGKHRRRKESY